MALSTLSNKSLLILESAQSGTARAALLGLSDGLVTNVSLILGVSATGAGSDIVRIAGIASLIAGGFSMAVGEYISMQGQVELLRGVLKAERQELREHPQSAKKSLREVLIADGMTPATANTASIEVSRDPAKAMALYARGKLGINPKQLGSPWRSAWTSLVMFACGAAVPLIPWFISSGMTAVITSVALSAGSALLIGSYLGYMTAGSPLRTALRQLLVLILAAGATFLVGLLFQTPSV